MPRGLPSLQGGLYREWYNMNYNSLLNGLRYGKRYRLEILKTIEDEYELENHLSLCARPKIYLSQDFDFGKKIEKEVDELLASPEVRTLDDLSPDVREDLET